MSIKTCTVDQCDRESRTQGLCNMHHLRLLRHGDVNYGADQKKPRRTAALCRVDDCDRHVSGDGYCRKHYQRVLTHGDPHTVGKPGPKPADVNTDTTELIVKPLRIAADGSRVLPCQDNLGAFDAVLDLTAWWTGRVPKKGARRVIDNARAICATCPLQLDCRAEGRERGLTGVVGGEYRPATVGGQAADVDELAVSA